jgi:hypothetical protein
MLGSHSSTRQHLENGAIATRFALMPRSARKEALLRQLLFDYRHYLSDRWVTPELLTLRYVEVKGHDQLPDEVTARHSTQRSTLP